VYRYSPTPDQQFSYDKMSSVFASKTQTLTNWSDKTGKTDVNVSFFQKNYSFGQEADPWTGKQNKKCLNYSKNRFGK